MGSSIYICWAVLDQSWSAVRWSWKLQTKTDKLKIYPWNTGNLRMLGKELWTRSGRQWFSPPHRPAKKAYIRLRWVGKKFTRKLSSCQQSVLKNLQEMWPGTSWAHQNFIGKMPAEEGAVKLFWEVAWGFPTEGSKVAVEALLHRKLLVMRAAPSKVYTPAPTTETKGSKASRTRKKTCLLQCSFKREKLMLIT